MNFITIVVLFVIVVLAIVSLLFACLFVCMCMLSRFYELNLYFINLLTLFL